MTFKLAYFCKRLLLRALRRLRRTVYIYIYAIFAIQVFGATARINVAKLTPHYYVCLCWQKFIARPRLILALFLCVAGSAELSAGK